MKNNKWFILLAGLFCLVFSACNDDEKVKPIGKFENGVVVLNEGNFTNSDGTITFYHTSGDSISNDVIKNQNAGSSLGTTLISGYVSGDNLFLIGNQPDKLEILSREDFKFKGQPIAGADISQPRSMTIIGNKAYVACWGPWGNNYSLPNSYVAVVDLNNRSVIKKIDVDDGAEGIVSIGNKVFVAGSYSNYVTVINATTDEKISSIETEYSPTNFAIDANQKLWVICKDSWGAGGSLARINPANHEVEEEWLIDGDAPIGKIAINRAKNKIYYITAQGWPNTGSNVYEMSITAATMPATPLITGNNFYAIGVDASDGTIYIGDSQGFATSGKVHRYQSNGTKINDFIAGVGPTGFLYY